QADTESAPLVEHGLTLRQICTLGQFCTASPFVSLFWGVPHNAALQRCLFDHPWAPPGHSRRKASTANPGFRRPTRFAFDPFWMRWFDQFLRRVTYAKSSTFLRKRG